jgi:hypothetical protein
VLDQPELVSGSWNGFYSVLVVGGGGGVFGAVFALFSLFWKSLPEKRAYHKKSVSFSHRYIFLLLTIFSLYHCSASHI